MEAVRIGVHRGRPHTAGSAFAADYDRSHTKLSEMRLQGSSKECASPLLGDDHVVLLWLEVRSDRVGTSVIARGTPFGCIEAFGPAISPDVHRCIEDWNFGGARSSEKPLGRFYGQPSMLAARARK